MSITNKFRRQNSEPEKMVLVVGIIFLVSGVILLQLVPPNWWIPPAMLITWGVGAIFNFAFGFVHRARQGK
jgi:fructose-specific phosphotransferase system IIC component